VSYGFYEAIAWFKQDSSKWMQIITDFKLVFYHAAYNYLIQYFETNHRFLLGFRT
jgi:hypothetical protein